MAEFFKFNQEVTSDILGKRLDLVLAIKQGQISRSAVRKIIDSGKVTINNKVEFRPNYKVRLGDFIQVVPIEVESQEVKLTPENIPLDIIYEDNDLLVVNKPAGMVIHPATGNELHTLMNAVSYYLKDIKGVGDELRNGLIHRIDKDTSGLILIGKTNEALWHYSRMFAERKVTKIYVAISAGNSEKLIKEKFFSITNYLGRNPGNRKKYSKVSPSKGKLAETNFELVKVGDLNGQEYSVIKAFPKTGRTHQIRVHLSSLGLPILGDVIYGKPIIGFRLMLHAWKIKVRLLDGQEKEFTAPLPKEFTAYFN